jgi:hypothetical protein
LLGISDGRRQLDAGCSACTRMKTSWGFDLRSLNAFVLACKTGSMAAAAQGLQMTQPAVSHIIRGLETSLGAPLIDRSRRPFSLTPRGAFLSKQQNRSWPPRSAFPRACASSTTASRRACMSASWTRSPVPSSPSYSPACTRPSTHYPCRQGSPERCAKHFRITCWTSS